MELAHMAVALVKLAYFSMSAVVVDLGEKTRTK